MVKKIFLIHGRDLDARDEVARFLRRLHFQVVLFEDVAGSLQTNPFIADVVFEGIRSADAVVAIFTPDEHAALYEADQEWGALGPAESSRWQARPNVIFEAGVALGVGREKTVLVSLGADVEFFSDVAGKHIIRLDSPKGAQLLRDQLSKVFPEVPMPAAQKTANARFGAVVRKRWSSYEEIHQLAIRLRMQELGDGPRRKSLERVIADAVRGQDLPVIKVWTATKLVRRIATTNKEYVEEAYWWLVVYGVLRFNDIDHWWDGEETWQRSLPYVQLTDRFYPFVQRLMLQARSNAVHGDGATRRKRAAARSVVKNGVPYKRLVPFWNNTRNVRDSLNGKNLTFDGIWQTRFFRDKDIGGFSCGLRVFFEKKVTVSWISVLAEKFEEHGIVAVQRTRDRSPETILTLFDGTKQKGKRIEGRYQFPRQIRATEIDLMFSGNTAGEAWYELRELKFG